MTHVGLYAIEKVGGEYVVKLRGTEVARFDAPGTAANWCMRRVIEKARA